MTQTVDTQTTVHDLAGCPCCTTGGLCTQCNDTTTQNTILNLSGVAGGADCANYGTFANASFLVACLSDPNCCSSTQTFVDSDNETGCQTDCGGGSVGQATLVLLWEFGTDYTLVSAIASRCGISGGDATWKRTGLANPRTCKSITLTAADLLTNNPGNLADFSAASVSFT